jgi:Putative restriction endonuclease
MSLLESPSAAAVPALPLHRLSVAQYHRMIDTGVLTEDERVELLEGWIVEKMPHNPPHAGTITRIERRLNRELSDNWLIRIQSAITTRDSEPEPDLAVVEGPEERYWERHPRPDEVALAIEVAESTLESDRIVKGRIYARARIPVYWIANLVDRRLEVYTEPKGGKAPGYRGCEELGVDASVTLVLRGDEVAQIPVKELLIARLNHQE